MGTAAGVSATTDRVIRLVVAVAAATTGLGGLGTALINVNEFAVSVLAIPLLAGLTFRSVKSAWKLTRREYRDEYVLRTGLKFYLLLGALTLAGAAYAVAAEELSIIGAYLVLLSQGTISVYKEIPSSESTTVSNTRR